MTIEKTMPNIAASREVIAPKTQKELRPKVQEVETPAPQASANRTPMSQDNLNSGSALAVSAETSQTAERAKPEGQSNRQPIQESVASKSDVQPQTAAKNSQVDTSSNTQGAIDSYNPKAERTNALNLSV